MPLTLTRPGSSHVSRPVLRTPVNRGGTRVEDVRNGLVSLEGARLDYGVAITDRETLTVDQAETARLRAA